MWSAKKRTWALTLGGASVGAVAGWLNALACTGTYLGASMVFLAASSWRRSRWRRKLLNTNFYLDRYWSDTEKDVLKRYAWYWQEPGSSVQLARVATVLLGLGLGSALATLLKAPQLWFLAAMCLGGSSFCARQIQMLDPITTLSTRVEKNDTSVSDEWGAVLEIRRQL